MRYVHHIKGWYSVLDCTAVTEKNIVPTGESVSKESQYLSMLPILILSGEMKMITNEKELENYIVNDDSFCDFLESMFQLKDVKVMGRQVHVGTENILDIIYQGKEGVLEEVAEKVYIIVELKYRILEAKDFAQLARYITALLDYTSGTKETFIVKGLLLGTGVGRDVACMINSEMIGSDIRVSTIETELSYQDSCEGWWQGAVNTSGAVDDCISQIGKGENENE